MMITCRLKSLRNASKLSQKKFAQELKVSQQTVASWESGRTEPSNDALKAIADYFNVTTDYLLGRKNIATCSLSSDQEALVGDYNLLNDEGRSTLISVLDSLKLSHAKKSAEATVVQKNEINNNYGVVGAHFNSTVTIK